jgi:hypothetical protein
MMPDLEATLCENSIDVSRLEVLWDEADGPLYCLAVDSPEAIDLWAQLRALTPQTGYWPVVMGADDVAGALLADTEYDDRPPAEIAALGECMDVESWLGKVEAHGLAPEAPPEGAWPESVEPPTDFWIPCETNSDDPCVSIRIALVPTKDGWKAPAFLKFGNWNACPAPEQHVSMLKSWADRYGAELVGISNDMLELRPGRLPASRDEALALAREQFLYCADIVQQGTETLSVLAALIMSGAVWSFWWS